MCTGTGGSECVSQNPINRMLWQGHFKTGYRILARTIVFQLMRVHVGWVLVDEVTLKRMVV